MSEDNVAVVKKLFSAVAERNGEAVLSVYADNVVIREAESLPYGGTYRGHEGAEHAKGYLQCWDALQSERERDMEPTFLGAKNHVTVLWCQKAAAGECGESLSTPVVSVYRLNGGRIAEATMYHMDTVALIAFLARRSGVVVRRQS